MSPSERRYEPVRITDLAIGDEIEWHLIASSDGWEWCNATVVGLDPLHVRFTDGTEKLMRSGATREPHLRRALQGGFVSTEQHIDPEVIGAALDAWFVSRGIKGSIYGPVELDAMQAALRAAEEKRRELAQALPEGQEYAYRVRGWLDGQLKSTGARSELHAKEIADDLRATPRATEVRVERTLLGTWERVDR